ncbi:sperm-associated antigen 5, partial [Aplochiton taeniatus]
VDHSVNTSGRFERKRELLVKDACTSTDSLLWNVASGSLESLPRQELEQRLTSTLIMAEALVQQLTAARGQGRAAGGPAPSDLRDRQVQTDHTELSQTSVYKDLYETALERIRELELDQGSLKSLSASMQSTRATMTALSSDTEAAFSSLKHIEDVIRDDHQSLATQFDRMKCLYERCKVTQGRLVKKVTDALQEREHTRQQMEEALTAKQAAFSVTEQLRAHCGGRIADLEECVGSHQDVLAALTKTYPEQVALKEAYVESLNLATELLSGAMGDHSSLHKELQAARLLLQQATPMLGKLNEKADAALRDRDQRVSEREQALMEMEQIQEDLDQAHGSLRETSQQIGDLNLQVTIMSSEMGVLRQQLSEGEEERAHLERKVTDLSATVSSTLASYAFLEQALAAESDKLQQSRQEVQKATSKANELEVSLGLSEQRVTDLSQALDHSEEQLGQLQAHCHGQSLQLQQLTEVHTQLKAMQEMSEFLQMENELAREQVVESEGLLRANLQGLRQRNIHYEDLKGAYSQLQTEKETLEVALQETRAQVSSVQLALGEQLTQAVTDITLLHHTLRGLTNQLHRALTDTQPGPAQVQGSQPSVSYERRPSSSFVDSIMVALTADKGEVEDMGSPADVPPESESVGLVSETSAFTRITPVTPGRCQGAEGEARGAGPEEEVEEPGRVVELLADLGHTVSELCAALGLLRQHKDAQLEQLHATIGVLQGEQQSQASRHAAVEKELRERLDRLGSQADRSAQALQQKTQDDKILTKLSMEVNEAMELLDKHKATNAELRAEVAELRRSLHQSQVEAQALREELGKARNPSTNPMESLDEKIRLLKEVERLKGCLQEGDQARVKLLERAKRHQTVHQTNQAKLENELRVLDNMIERARKTLSSVPDVVKNCEKLKRLVEYLG